MPLTAEEERRWKQLMMERTDYDRQRQSLTHQSVESLAAPPESEDFRMGRKLPTPFQGAAKFLQGASLGIYPTVLPPKMEDIVRGGLQEFSEKYPKTSFGFDIAGSLVPSLVSGGAGMVVRPAISAVPAEMSAAQRVGTAAMQGGTEGAISGGGYSQAQTPEDRIKDILFGGLMGSAGGGGMSGATNVLGGAITNVGERISERVALSEAQKRLIQALIRDTPEGQQFGPSAAARLRALGPEGALLDTGENARQLADLLATLPGQSKTELRDFVEGRARKRGERMAEAGQAGLETGGKRLLSTLDDLAQQRTRDAGPLYRRLETLTIDDPTGEIADIVRQADEWGATKIGEQIAKSNRITQGGKGWTYAGPDTKRFSASDLANIKEGLDDLVEKETDAVTGRRSKLGSAYANVRDKLRQQIVNRTPDPETGESIYGHALDAWAGPSAARDAANFGRTVLNRSVSADQLRKDLAKMSQSELEAMRIGAFEAIRDKVGTSKAGRTEMMNLVENFVPREKLQVLFGSPEKFDQFYRTMLAERTMREADALGRGSQTASRQTALGELNADVALDVAGMAQGGPLNFITSGTKMWNQAQLPEKTRTQLSRLLMMQGPRAEQDVFGMEAVARKIAEKRRARAAVIGSGGGGASTRETQDKNRR